MPSRNRPSTVEQFKAMKVGHSVFFPDATTSDLAWLRKPLLDAGVNCVMRERLYDNKAKGPGVRVWRVKNKVNGVQPK